MIRIGLTNLRDLHKRLEGSLSWTIISEFLRHEFDIVIIWWLVCLWRCQTLTVTGSYKSSDWDCQKLSGSYSLTRLDMSSYSMYTMIHLERNGVSATWRVRTVKNAWPCSDGLLVIICTDSSISRVQETYLMVKMSFII